MVICGVSVVHWPYVAGLYGGNGKGRVRVEHLVRILHAAGVDGNKLATRGFIKPDESIIDDLEEYMAEVAG